MVACNCIEPGVTFDSLHTFNACIWRHLNFVNSPSRFLKKKQRVDIRTLLFLHLVNYTSIGYIKFSLCLRVGKEFRVQDVPKMWGLTWLTPCPKPLILGMPPHLRSLVFTPILQRLDYQLQIFP